MKYKIWNIISNTIILICVILLVSFIFQVFALNIVEEAQDVEFIVGNQTYKISENVDINSLTIGSNFIEANSFVDRKKA